MCKIDFDALWNEYEQKYSCKKSTNCDNCTYPNKLYYTTICFVDFLKSKHMTAHKKFEIPVKRTWKLKLEYAYFCKKLGIEDRDFCNYNTKPTHPEFYDLHEEPDYSKIPVGAVVGIDFTDGFYCGVVERFTGKEFVISCKKGVEALGLSLEHIKSIEILKMPEVK